MWDGQINELERARTIAEEAEQRERDREALEVRERDASGTLGAPLGDPNFSL